MSEHGQKHEVRIHIDQHKYESPKPRRRPRDVHLREDEHLHSGPHKPYRIT